MAEIIIVPGIGGSGELHWQTRWEKANPRWHRLRPAGLEYSPNSMTDQSRHLNM